MLSYFYKYIFFVISLTKFWAYVSYGLSPAWIVRRFKRFWLLLENNAIFHIMTLSVYPIWIDKFMSLRSAGILSQLLAYHIAVWGMCAQCTIVSIRVYCFSISIKFHNMTIKIMLMWRYFVTISTFK